MNDTPIHSVSVAGVTFDEAGRVLLVKRRDNGQWQAPGGILELAETFEDGVVREVLEETGVAVNVERLTGVYKNLSRGVVALVYRCTPLRGTPVPTEESEESAWIEASRIDRIMPEAFAVRVRDALSTENPASRAHNGEKLL